tara:strand:+ start:26046 stop:27362 length:1317 start_codon:yes stop_codon:yes gene_type:complete
MPRFSHKLPGPLTFVAIATVLSAQAPNWVQITPTTQPPGRQNSALAHDVQRGVSILFGGWDGTQRRNDTWEWNGTVWNQITTLNSPSPRDGMSMAYDAVRQVTVCTAGYVAPGETWEYDGVDWTLNVTANTHALGPHRPMVYDLVRGVCVLFGQSSASGSPETWEYDGVDWTQVATVSAPGTNGNLAYDLVRMRTVHFGDSGQTWEYDGITWTQMSPNNAPPGAGCGSDNMVYDLARQVVVLFGGCNLGDTYEYDGVSWQQITTANAPSFPRRYPAMTYDFNRQRTVLFGGRDLSTTPASLADDTWEYGPSGTLAVNTPYGTGCGGLTIAGSTRPITNTFWNLGLGNLPTGTIVAAILFGTANPNLSLSVIAPGCTQYSGATAVVLLPLATPTYSFAIPNNPIFIGFDVYSQGVALVPGANPLGVAMSAGLLGTVGDI